jgi:4-nitrophenyl phosphatase
MLNNIRNLILDMDGVLWRGETPMPGLNAFFGTLAELDIDFVLATNNASKNAAQYVSKLNGFGLDIPPAKILNSADATADFLRQQLGFENGQNMAIYVVGDEGLRQSLASRGFTLLTPEAVYKGATAPVVVVGFTRYATYPDLAMAALLVHKGATFVGTNPDVSFPSEVGPLPGAGALQAVITSATGHPPDHVVGKPGPIIFHEALRRLNGTAENTAMVGDRLETDILGAKNAGIPAILLLSGITQPGDWEQPGKPQPDFIFEDIDALAAALRDKVRG